MTMHNYQPNISNLKLDLQEPRKNCQSLKTMVKYGAVTITLVLSGMIYYITRPIEIKFEYPGLLRRKCEGINSRAGIENIFMLLNVEMVGRDRQFILEEVVDPNTMKCNNMHSEFNY